MEKLVSVVYYAFFISVGAAMGSFANVAIYRLPRNMSVNNPTRSFCPFCGNKILWFDNIPLVSYILLRAKCRFCKAPISFRYFLVEALSSFCFLICAYHFHPPGNKPPDMTSFFLALSASAFSLALIICSFIDAAHKIIPDVIDIPGIFAGVGLSFLLPNLQQDTEPVKALFRLIFAENRFSPWLDTRLIALSSSIIGAATGAVVILIVAILGKKIFKREAMGFGDVKYLAMIGAFLGFKFVLIAFVIACLVGTVVGLPILISGKKYHEIPFGPFLSLGGFVMLIWGGKVAYFVLELYPRWVMGES
ncbi:MAG: prepilin peptidase [Planctomycetota bacterium]|nr:prepilin peptidase [Planctomycetota bacterium]